MPEDADILAGLFGLRETAPGLLDAVAAFAIGLVLAGLLGWALSAVRTGAPRTTLADRLALAEGLQGADRVLHLASILREATDHLAPGPEPWSERAAVRFGFDAAETRALRASLYRPDGVNPDRLATMAAEAARVAGR